MGQNIFYFKIESVFVNALCSKLYDFVLSCYYIFVRFIYVHLHVIEDEGALAPGSIQFENVSGEDLTTPAVDIFTLDFDVSGQKEDFTTHVDSVLSLS